MQRDAGHYVYEETMLNQYGILSPLLAYVPGHLIKRMKYHRVSPHSYCDCIVSICQAICTNEEAF